MRSTAPLWLASLVLLTGCAAFSPRDDAALSRAASAATSGPSPLVAPAVGTAATAIESPRWEGLVGDGLLRRRVEAALERNRDLRLAALNVEQARAQLGLREADLWPTLQAGIGANRVATNSGGVSTTVSGGLLTTAYELDLFGRVRAGTAAAQAQLQGSVALQSAARSALISAVVSAHVALTADEAALQLAQHTLRSRQENLRIAQQRVAVGAGSALDVAQAETLVHAARVALAQVQRQRALDESTLVLLLGQPLNGALADASRSSNSGAADASAELARLQTTAQALSSIEGLPSSLLSARPDIVAAEAQVRAAQSNVEAARAAFFPRIALTASFGQASRDLAGLFAGGTWVWGVAPQLLQTLFDAGRAQAGVDGARTAQAVALTQYEKAVQVAFKETHDALLSIQALREQAQAVQSQVAAETLRLELAQTRQRLGAASALEVLDAQRSLFAAQLLQIQTQALWVQNAANLIRAVGGGAAGAQNG